MTFEVRPTKASLDDAAAIADYIAGQGFPDNAERWVRELMEVLAGLSELPQRCPIAPENDEVESDEMRQCIFGDYRILFTVTSNHVFVLHVRHGRRRFATKEELVRAIEEVERLR